MSSAKDLQKLAKLIEARAKSMLLDAKDAKEAISDYRTEDELAHVRDIVSDLVSDSAELYALCERLEVEVG